ncbi:hypothetical protein CHU94_08310 [Rhodoferax sp. TH121]|uniref:tape measure protein n=1 Tax=Rhodoferax sp. TH121 TaxID=2022803 RepID=UPI000B975E3A|nr:tape measure protein [Rhodoferax sp. TH121]OYQ41103.1 hypothetical protein CHU94_08310 [Rhodoferax sp. TH121]
MAEKVGELYYSVTLDTREMIDGQRKVDRELKNTSNSLDAMSTKLTATAAAVAVLAAGFAAVRIAKLADEFRLLGARIEVAAGSIESGSAAFADLVKISRATQSSLAGNIEVFARLNQSILQMGGTQQDTLQLTELLAKAIKVSGASAVEAKSAMLQFGQALGSGKLAGDELRSLLENAPYLMRQLADGIGVPVGSLKMLGEQGKLTADVVTNALTKAAAQIDEDFKKFPQTIESAMVVAQDAAALAALKFDELTGSSAALTGVTKGLGDVMEKLADQLGAANSEAGNLGRNSAVKDWADSSRNALSYLVDAADVVWQTLSVLGRNVAFVFEGIGKEIGGIGAQVAAVLRGDFAGARAIGEAMVADSEARRKALDEADARTLSRAKTFGKQMREAWDQGAGGGRGSVNPMAAPSQLSAPASAGGGTKKGAAGPKFDALAYLSDLRKAQASEISIINETEAEKLRIAKRNLDEKKISEAQYVEAVKLIQTAAEEDRVELMRKTQEKINQERERADIAAQRAAEQRKSNQDVAKREIAATNPIDAIRFEEEQKIAVIEAYRLQDLANTQLYEDAKAAIHAKAAADIKAVQDASMVAQLQGYGQLFGGIADVTKAFAGEQDDTYKALFAASKAFAMADAIIKIQQGIASAASLPFPSNLGAMATVAAQTAGIVSTISGTNYGGGRQYGGPVSSGSMYRVNETGAPEMFTANNGNQYMLPTKSGSVTAADSIGGGGISVVVNVDASGSSVEGDGAQSKQLGAMIGNAVRAVLIQEKRNGGLLA